MLSFLDTNSFPKKLLGSIPGGLAKDVTRTVAFPSSPGSAPAFPTFSSIGQSLMGLWRRLLRSSPRLVRLVSQRILASLRLRQLLVHAVMFMAVTAMSASPSDEVQRIILVLTCGWVLWLSFVVNHTNRTLDVSEFIFEY
jgi:hypothetical protein